MPSILTQIVERLDEVIKAAVPAGTTVSRDRADAFSREECPAVNVLPDQPTVETFAHGWDRHEATVAVDIHVRAEPYTPAADALHQPVHAAVTTDATLIDLAPGVRLVSIDYLPAEADMTAFRKRCIYRFTFLSPKNLI